MFGDQLNRLGKLASSSRIIIIIIQLSCWIQSRLFFSFLINLKYELHLDSLWIHLLLPLLLLLSSYCFQIAWPPTLPSKVKQLPTPFGRRRTLGQQLWSGWQICRCEEDLIWISWFPWLLRELFPFFSLLPLRSCRRFFWWSTLKITFFFSYFSWCVPARSSQQQPVKRTNFCIAELINSWACVAVIGWICLF